jgi:alpha-beta hydrolase superfamily lysophospholipase
MTSDAKITGETAPEAFTLTGADGRGLAALHWRATIDRATECVVVLVHGMGEHIRRYARLADRLANAGFEVYGYDQRGHGESKTKGTAYGDLGENGWTAIVLDIVSAVTYVRARHPGLPVALVSHSMGSFAVQQFLPGNGSSVDAVALTGTAALDLIEPLIDPTTDVDLSAFNAAFAPARTDFDWLSRDNAEVDAYVVDPACGSGLDARSSESMFAGARVLSESSAFEAVPHHLPVYVAVGSMDPVNGGLTFLWPLVDRMRASGVDDVTVRVYDGARHELFNETNRAEVTDDLLQWIRRATVDPPSASSRPATTDEGRP